MEDVVGNANNVIDEKESSDSVSSPLFSGTKLNKRFRSKVYKCVSGTSSLLRHQANCIPRTQKRPRLQQEHTSLPSKHKSTAVAGSGPKQKKLQFSQYNQKKSAATADAAPKWKEPVLPDTCTKMNRRNQEVGQNGFDEELSVPKQTNLVLPGISTEKNKSHGQIASPGQKNIPTGTNKKNQDVDQNRSPKELVRILAMHGHLPRMVEQDGFRKLVAWLNPMARMPSRFDLMGNTWNLHDQEVARLKQRLAALHSRVCLSAYMWHYDPRLAFLCLTVHYINDEWEKQQKIIRFSPVNPSCNADELSAIIFWAIEKWVLVARFSALYWMMHLLMIQWLQMSKLDSRNGTKLLQIGACLCSTVPQLPITAEKICEILQRFHKYMDSIHNSPSPVNSYDSLWDVKKEIRREADFYRQAGFAYKDEGFSKESCRTLDREIDDYIHFMHDTLVSLFYEYSHLVVDTNSSSGSKTSKETAVDGDMLVKYYHETEYPFGKRPLTELDQYLQEPCLPTGESSVLQRWKEHCLTYPTIVLMARDILALPCSTDCKVAATTAKLVMSESGNERWIEDLVCIQGWLTPASMTCVLTFSGLAHTCWYDLCSYIFCFKKRLDQGERHLPDFRQGTCRT
ncbi:hypothetical protein BAE44_0023720 [Dichanthelium oligosanthes]|uniref:HAT C-terminal dimerisation domain-containing protein n=1 Tax=Dichanthelium oligosanthes TaxID=888268 RepID=A0A1E5UQW2_9POAL|nr:hypothetical protein BAE44_0023720 [Dichanthelium oligosanthes]